MVDAIASRSLGVRDFGCHNHPIGESQNSFHLLVVNIAFTRQDGSFWIDFSEMSLDHINFIELLSKTGRTFFRLHHLLPRTRLPPGKEVITFPPIPRTHYRSRLPTSGVNIDAIPLPSLC